MRCWWVENNPPVVPCGTSCLPAASAGVICSLRVQFTCFRYRAPAMVAEAGRPRERQNPPVDGAAELPECAD